MKKQEVAVIGGGITGLIIAYRMLQNDNKVTIYEKDSKLGGLLQSTKIGKEQVELIYHHIFTSDTYIIDLIEELGLGDTLKWYTPKNGLYIDNKIYPFTSPFDLISFKPIPFFERIKTGLSVLKAKSIKDYIPLEDITAKEWLLKNSGVKAYEKLWTPLLKSKFDKDSDKVSAVWIWNKFKLRGNSRSNVSSENLGYLDNGFGYIIDVLEKKIKDLGGVIKTSTDVEKITDNKEVIVKGKKEKYNKIIAAVATPIFSELIKDIKNIDTYKKILNKIDYKANICMILDMKEPLSDYYWTTVCEELPFVLVIEQNNLMDDKNYAGHVVYLSRYLDKADPMWKKNDKEIYKDFVSGLKHMYPEFKDSDIKSHEIFKNGYTQPVVLKNYSKNKPSIKTPIKDIYLAGMSQIYPEDRGVNYAARLAEETYKIITEEIE